MAKLPYNESEHSARLAMNDPKANAYEWIKAYAKQLSREDDPDDREHVSVDELITHALARIEHPESWDCLVKGGALEGMSTDPMLYDKIAILYDLEIEDHQKVNFFSCSC